MTSSRSALARALLQAERERRTMDVAAALRPASLVEGYQAQAATAALSGRTQIGWKIGATTAASQARRGISEPLYGRLFKELAHASPAKSSRSNFIEPHLEAEFGFIMGRPLPQTGTSYGRRDVVEAIDALVLAIEIADGRCTDWRTCDGALAAADNVGHGAVVTSAPIKQWPRWGLADVGVTLSIDGAQAASGRGSNVMGEPLDALAWLANTLARDGHPLQSGDLVISGTCTGLTALGSGQRVIAQFEGQGAVTADFSPSAA